MAKRKPVVLGRPPHVALIVETSLGAGREILRGIAQYVREHGPWAIYHEPRNLEDSVPTWLRRWRGEGIIARLENERITHAVAETGLPAVDVLGVAPHPKVPLVHVDDVGLARLAAEHLLERGFRQFAYCGIKGVNWSYEREAAFVAITTAAGYPCRVYHLPSLVRTDRSWEAEQERLARWVAHLPKPVGVMVCHDPRGQRVLEACRRAGVAVPEEVAVIGVDNDEPVCEVSDPPLSSVVPDFHGIGYQAARLLDKLMHGEAPPASPVYLPPQGVAARQSTDVLAIDDRDVAEAVRFIRQHACEPLTVDDVAQHVSLSRSVLKRRFRNVLGRSVHDEIVRMRIKRAEELLAQTDMPIRAIAEKTGFHHQEYLGVVFKARTGKTPAGFRRQCQAGPKSTNFGPRSP
jgi:LacI family transcriptional regulator